MTRMRSLIPLALFALLTIALVFPCCCPPAGQAPPPPNPAGAFVAGLAGAFVDRYTGAPLSQAPPPPECGGPSYVPPTYEEDAFKGDAGACASISGDPCADCAKAACCTETLDCFKEGACICRTACRTIHCPAEKADQCATVGPLDAYSTLDACLSQHCAQHCPAVVQ